MRERAAARDGALRTPCLPAPYSLLTPSVAARRAAVGRGALGWAGLGAEVGRMNSRKRERMWEQCIQASSVAWAHLRAQGWPWHAPLSVI